MKLSFQRRARTCCSGPWQTSHPVPAEVASCGVSVMMDETFGTIMTPEELGVLLELAGRVSAAVSTLVAKKEAKQSS